MPQAAPQNAPSQPAPTPAPANDQGVLDRVLSHFAPNTAAAPGASEPSRMGALAKSAMPFALMAARRVPVGLAVIGVAAAGIALANPTTREKIFATGRKGLDALRR